MESYTNINELFYDSVLGVYHYGDELDSRAGKTKEILGFQATLEYPENNIILGYPTRKFSLPYACAELLWYLSFTGDIRPMLEHYAPSYGKYCENGIAYGAYGQRWKSNPGFVAEDTVFFHPNGKNQLEVLIELLKAKDNTRQAILSMWDSGDLVHALLGDHGDLPCTLTLKFFVRKDKLHCIADMRSNDVWLGLPYDIFCFTTLQRIIAEECGLNLGKYIHQAGSQHIYERNFEKVEQIINEYEVRYPIENDNRFHIASEQSLQEKINIALRFEEAFRSGKGLQDEDHDLFWSQSSVFKDLVVGTATKWIDMQPEDFDGILFAKWQEQNLERKNGK